MTRRTLLSASFAAPLFAGKPFRYAEVEAKIARRDFRDLTKDDLGTPALIVDRALLDQNLRKMAEYTKANQIGVRPHCKVHKSVDLARKQMALGALGITVATVAEAELMVNAGLKGVLYTSQPAGKNKLGRAIQLAAKDPTFALVADDPLTVDLLDEAAAAFRTKVTVLPDIYAGLTRHGHAAGEAGVALAQRIDSKKNLKLGGMMGYSGAASHTPGWEERRKKSYTDVSPMVETASRAKAAGLNLPIITGGSTGTYNIDRELGLTELQAGSYVFMDTGYAKIGGKGSPGKYEDFAIAMTVLATVISRNHPNQATIDAGNKALLRPTDQVKGRPDMVVENQGAEYGILRWNQGDELKLGQKVELYTTNLDMTTNCYDRYYVCEGDRVVDVWPIMGRAGAPQR
jgi:D-serine deaminase-like pyridoxal phosphate-dependent protein